MADRGASADSGRLVQAAETQSVFREVNERIKELDETLGGRTRASWVCECEDGTCIDSIGISAPEYERLRAHGNRFAVKPGHENLEVEDVTERYGEYVVVAKRGAGGDVAIEKDPRSRRDR
jgi:hypothetical protein